MRKRRKMEKKVHGKEQKTKVRKGKRKVNEQNRKEKTERENFMGLWDRGSATGD